MHTNTCERKTFDDTIALAHTVTLFRGTKGMKTILPMRKAQNVVPINHTFIGKVVDGTHLQCSEGFDALF